MTTDKFQDLAKKSTLGKKENYPRQYDRSLLFPIPRQAKRNELGLSDALPFHGIDILNCYEISWLNPHGKPMVAVGTLRIPCISTHIIESKSLKLYLTSLNQKKFETLSDVEDFIFKDLSDAAGTKIDVKLSPCCNEKTAYSTYGQLPGKCIDHLDVSCNTYNVTPDFLETEENQPPANEALFSHLFRSNCPVTNQPDWASIYIHYQGSQISHEGLLKYLVSYRQHNDFHEQCAERIFLDIQDQCRPEKLTVYARFTRRGGIDINPFRSNFEVEPENVRLDRQ